MNVNSWHSAFPRSVQHRRALSRRGATFTEVIVGAGLLLVGVGLIAKSSSSISRIWHDTRRYQLAIDELDNQMDRLLVLAPVQRQDALANLKPSTTAQSVLPMVTLAGKQISDDLGSRIHLELNWQRMGIAQPLELISWLPPTVPHSAEATETTDASNVASDSNAQGITP